MTDTDRIETIADLLLGAAYADGRLETREKESVRTLLTGLTPSQTQSPELEARIEGFQPDGFDLGQVAQQFAKDPPVSKTRLLELIAAVNESDEVLDLSEDDYLRQLAAHLDMPSTATEKLVLNYEVEDLRECFESLRPPPLPDNA